MRTKEYIIYLKPRPWQRARLNGKHFFDGQAKDKLAFGLYLSKLHGTEPMFEGPISVTMLFYMALPKSMAQAINQGKYHIKRPDHDNLVAYVNDAAQGILWADDCIIAEAKQVKIYDKIPRTHLIVTELK